MFTIWSLKTIKRIDHFTFTISTFALVLWKSDMNLQH